MPRSARALCLALLFAAGPLSSVVAPTPAAADRAYRTEARLPTPRSLLTAVSAGRYVYIFGGWYNWLDDILRFDPAAQTVVKMPSRLPEPLRGAGAVWDGSHVYLFAGRTPAGYSNKILRYDPATDSIVTMPTRLPWVDELVSAVWDGKGNAYIVGGWYGTHGNRITRYTPATDTVSVMGATLRPAARGGTGAFFDGRYLYALNQVGLAEGDTSVDRYDPVTDITVRMQAKIPHGWAIGTAWDGRSAYVFGGSEYWHWYHQPYDTIVRYDPVTDSATLMNSRLPSARTHSAAIWTGEGIYVIGGHGYDEVALGQSYPSQFFDRYLDEIVRYDPVPFAPTNVVAGPGSELGQVRVTWEQPGPRNTYGSPITGYRVFRADNVGQERLVAEVPDQTFYLDAGCPIGAVCGYRVAAVNTTGEGDRSLPAAFPGWKVPG